MVRATSSGAYARARELNRYERGLDAAGGEQGLDHPLVREAACVEDEREESCVVEVHAVERSDPRVFAVVVVLERLLRAVAVDEVLALVGSDSPLERRPQAHVNRRVMLRQ